MADKTLLDRIQAQIDENLKNRYDTQKAAAFQALDRLNPPMVGPQLPSTTPEEQAVVEDALDVATAGTTSPKPLLKGLPPRKNGETFEELVKMGSPDPSQRLENIKKAQNIKNRMLDRSEALAEAIKSKRKSLIKKIQDYYRK